MIEPTLLRHVRNDKELIHLVIDHSSHSASKYCLLKPSKGPKAHTLSKFYLEYGPEAHTLSEVYSK